MVVPVVPYLYLPIARDAVTVPNLFHTMEMVQPENKATMASLTEEEATRYDRQMRLWGIEAQQR